MTQRGNVLKDATVVLNGTDISQYVREVHMPEQFAQIDASGMRSDGAMEWETGMYQADITIVAKSAFGAAALNEVVRDLFESQVDFETKINPHSGSTSETNPQYQATTRMFTNNEIDAALGNLMTNSIALKVQGQIVRVFT